MPTPKVVTKTAHTTAKSTAKNTAKNTAKSQRKCRSRKALSVTKQVPKTESNGTGVYFDECTRLVFRDHATQLLDHLCHGNTHFSQTVLRHELGHFLPSAELQKNAAELKDTDQLCHFLRSSMEIKGLFQRMFRMVADATTYRYHLILQTLNAEHYLATFLNTLRSDMSGALFQFIYFHQTPELKEKTAAKEYTVFAKKEYGEEFFLVHNMRELQTIRKKYVEYVHQLMSIVQRKHFRFQDMFSGRNPAYYFDKEVDRDLVKLLKAKAEHIVNNCNVLIQHVFSSEDFSAQTTKYRKMLDQQRRHAKEMALQEARLSEKKLRNKIERRNANVRFTNMAIRLVKLGRR
jgi:hypothetical protein